jgi:SAM-dependent methyltransferase
MAAAKPAVPAQVDYGIDAPRELKRQLWRGILLILLGAGLYLMNRTDAPAGGLALLCALGCMGLGFLGAAAVMYQSSRVWKVQYRDRILDALPWRGDEKVLDAGCGRGLFLIGVAKRLTKAGKAVGVDLWSTDDLSGNSAEAAMGNAKAEGVADRVRIENGDMRRLSYQPGSFDAVLSSLAIHNLADTSEREKAVAEMLRVLKPGGHLAILDILHTGDYIRVAEQNGAEIVQKSGLSFLWCLPTRWFIARKRSS